MPDPRPLSEAKARERRVCHFFEALLKVEFSERPVCVTPAPFPDDLPDELLELLDGSGVVDVVIGPLRQGPAWAAFRCDIQDDVSRKDWGAAGQAVLDEARKQIGRWPSTVDLLQEAARRANWDAQHGPRHLRTGRFNPSDG